MKKFIVEILVEIAVTDFSTFGIKEAKTYYLEGMSPILERNLTLV